MAEVFISYASADRQRAKRLAEAMVAKGYSVWWDRQIAPGQTFDEVIEKALDEAKCVVVLWSSSSVTSDWVKTEAAEAAKRKILVPALIDDVRIPLEFRRIQAANLTQWAGQTSDSDFEKFLAAVDLEIQENSGPRSAPLMPRSVSSTSGAAAVMALDSRAAPEVRAAPAPAPAPVSKARPGLGKWVLGIVSVLAVVVGSTVWLNQAAQVQIPNVVGMSYDAAAATLAAANLGAERRERASGTDAPGTIVEQSPAAGTMQAKDATVTLTVALPRPVDPSQLIAVTASAPVADPKPDSLPPADAPVTVPDVKGQTTDRALELLTAAGLKIGVRTDVAINDVSLGNIISQDPASAATLVKGSAVNITVAARRKVPDLVGFDLQKAQDELRKLGLSGTLQRMRASAGDKDNRVVKQSPAAGIEIENGGQTQLTITIVTPKTVSGGESLFKTNGQRCVQTCKDLELKWTGQWSGGNNTCTCDFQR